MPTNHAHKMEGMWGAADCTMKGCEGKDHNVWFQYNEKKEVTQAYFECRRCGTFDPPLPTKDVEDSDLFPIHPDRIIKR